MKQMNSSILGVNPVRRVKVKGKVIGSKGAEKKRVGKIAKGV